jgi:hypothetical protein
MDGSDDFLDWLDQRLVAARREAAAAVGRCQALSRLGSLARLAQGDQDGAWTLADIEAAVGRNEQERAEWTAAVSRYLDSLEDQT